MRFAQRRTVSGDVDARTESPGGGGTEGVGGLGGGGGGGGVLIATALMLHCHRQNDSVSRGVSHSNVLLTGRE